MLSERCAGRTTIIKRIQFRVIVMRMASTFRVLQRLNTSVFTE
jgi:hypothetical protein